MQHSNVFGRDSENQWSFRTKDMWDPPLRGSDSGDLERCLWLGIFKNALVMSLPCNWG
jgi:hypothetical protein